MARMLNLEDAAEDAMKMERYTYECDKTALKIRDGVSEPAGESADVSSSSRIEFRRSSDPSPVAAERSIRVIQQ